METCSDRSPELRADGTRYPVSVFLSELDQHHGRQVWIDELFFPREGIVCNVTWEPRCEFDEERGLQVEWSPALHVFFGTLEKRMKANPPDPPFEPVAVSVPAGMVDEIRRIITEEQRLEDARKQLAEQIIAAGWMPTQPKFQERTEGWQMQSSSR